MLEKENNTPYYFLPYTTDGKTRGVGGGGVKWLCLFFFEPETVSICDFDGSATLMAQGITEPFKVKGDFSHLPSSVDSALHLSWFGLPLH